MEIGKLWGMSIKIHPTFLLVLVIYGVLGLIVQALLVFTLVALHELAHLFAAKSFGFKVKGFELFPFGGAAYCEDSFEGRKFEEASMALAGPLLNIILMAGMALLRWMGWLEGAWTTEFLQINFWLAVFNLIPVLPLDGGRVVRALLADVFGFVRTTKGLAKAGQFLGVLLAVLGLTLWGSYHEEMVTFLMLGGFFWVASGKEVAAARITFLRGITKKKEELVRKGLLRSKTLTAHPETPLIRIVEELSPDKYALIAITGERFALAKTLTETEVVDGMLNHGIHYPVGQLLE